ncbi:homeobox and leucine zipper protein Homez isoform X2 [Pteronotus mesoamericanus]|nr:homeobox and leucine zipper protein Homez isoform X2 [Pteronotus parnellii mesoamericanus]XP_054433801.1 homeobox and leucine zipper protein Homez isoform X2 [Pteronotus parnellii mesoamericanus]XP_054433802.1 homeobox and leucine zipper protein Homez isoform X2 [Pteronotus parnellii mesoamericanus]
MPPNKEASSLNTSHAGLICLPPISEDLQLVWTQAAQTSELDGNEHLLQTFSYFPYPSLADIALLCLRYGLQMEKVKTWFMAQRLRCGISWSSEEIEETRARVVYHRDQLHFKSLLSFTHHAGRPPEEVPSSPVPPPEQVSLGIVPLTLSEPAQMKGLKVEPEDPSEPLSHQKAKEPLVAPGSGALSHQSEFWQDLQSSGLSKGQAGRGPDQSHGLGTASWNHSTAAHQPHVPDKPTPTSLPASSCKQGSASNVTPPSSTSSSSFQVLANGTTATSIPLQSLGCLPQPLSPNEQALPAHVEPAWPQRLRPNSVIDRVGPAEYLSPDTQRQRKTKRKTKEQLAILKSFFLQCQWARREDYHKLEQITGLPRPEIIQWFGDTRYALKHGQLKWFRDNAVSGALSFQDPAVPTPSPSTRSLNEWAETPPLPMPPPPPDIRPLERYWAAHQQLRERDVPQLSQESRLSTQQVLDWFDSRLPEPAEVVVCLDEEEEEEEEEVPEDEDEEEEEEEEDDSDDDVIIQD